VIRELGPRKLADLAFSPEEVNRFRKFVPV